MYHTYTWLLINGHPTDVVRDSHNTAQLKHFTSHFHFFLLARLWYSVTSLSVIFQSSTFQTLKFCHDFVHRFPVREIPVCRCFQQFCPSFSGHAFFDSAFSVTPAYIQNFTTNTSYWVVGCWHGYLSGARCRLTCIWPSGFHCHSLSLASFKSRLVLPSGTSSPG